MMNFNTPIPTDQNTCATCYYCSVSSPSPRPWSNLPQPTYTCAFTGHKVNPCLRPCPLYKALPPPHFPAPTRPNSHPPTP